MSASRKHGVSKHVLSSEGRYLGIRHVMYCRETKMYVSGDCTTTTPDRTWAWSGTSAQSQRAREVYKIGPEFVMYQDGEEKNSV